jgi:death-on-curing protein
MRYLTVAEVLEIHSQIMREAGSTLGVHSLTALESAVAQPRMTLHAALETFLVLIGHEIAASVDEQFAVIPGVAAGETSREEFTACLREHIGHSPRIEGAGEQQADR